MSISNGCQNIAGKIRNMVLVKSISTHERISFEIVCNLGTHP